MKERTRQFWLFQAAFWAIAGAALFISGLTQMPFAEALVRNLFLLVAGFLTSFFLARAIDELRWLEMLRLRVVSYALAYLVALFCVVFINAISFTLRQVALEDMSFGQWVSGAMNLGLLYAFWSELFIQQIYLVRRNQTDPPPERIVIEHAGNLMQLALDDIDSVSAGDYVEFNCAGRSYLNRQTLQSLEESLGSEVFLRIHRSTLVNRGRVESVKPLGKGRFQLNLRGGSSVTSSRGYQDAIQQAFLAGG